MTEAPGVEGSRSTRKARPSLVEEAPGTLLHRGPTQKTITLPKTGLYLKSQVEQTMTCQTGNSMTL